MDLFSHAHGENFGMKFAKYFDRPDIEGIAPIYGHYIDPITRTSENLIIIKKIFTGLFKKGFWKFRPVYCFFKRRNDTFLLIEIYEKRNSNKTNPEGNLS